MVTGRHISHFLKRNASSVQRGSGGEDTFCAWPGISSSATSMAKKVSYITPGCDVAPFSMSAWAGTTAECFSDPESSVYGFVVEGPVSITRLIDTPSTSSTESLLYQFTMTLHEGMYFACPGQCRVSGGAGVAIVAPNKNSKRPDSCLETVWARHLSNHRALFSVGGPVLDFGADGRLPYIDGCSDTLLVSPVVKGAPCLNHLHFPPNIKQTQHTHPSGRAGVVIRGRGRCVVEMPREYGDDNNAIDRLEWTLEPGTAFVIPANVRHAFETTAGPGEEEETLDVFAFHPDSDFGPAPTDHPMVNRTVVDGVSASLIPEIQTSQVLIGG